MKLNREVVLGAVILVASFIAGAWVAHINAQQSMATGLVWLIGVLLVMPVAVIGLGTATTILVISATGLVVGGFIAPGLNLALASLHQHTALLPLLTMDSARQNVEEHESGSERLIDTTLALGFDTNSHMLNGIFSGHLGMIRQWLELARERLGCDLFAVATGGFSRSTLFAQANEKYKLFDSIDPQLTLKGIYLIADTVANQIKSSE